MAIGSIGYNNAANQLKAEQAIENYKKSVAEKEEKTTAEVSEGYEKSEQKVLSESGIYSKENIRKTVEQIEEQRAAAMTQMIQDMLGQQANAAGLDFVFGDSAFDLSKITQSDIDEAKASIEGDGYWSVNSVATRIMDMAKLLAGGDSSKLAMLKDAVIKGFGGAVSQFGFESMDDMPEITRQTYDEVMSRFDKWEEELSGGTSAEETAAAE